MADAAQISSTFLACLDASDRHDWPYAHWLLDRALPEATCAAIDALPVAPPKIADTLGKRETNNSTRWFFGAEHRARYPVCDALAAALQSEIVVDRLQSLCSVDLKGSSLRIEYCLDTDGFWLEPHTDIGVKLFTMLIYLSTEKGSEAWGTDVYDGDMNLVETAPYKRDTGLIFIPGHDTWHGFRKRKIDGVRRSLIVNFVKPEWRSRQELAYPDRPVGRA